jgi:hypothetical protein
LIKTRFLPIFGIISVFSVFCHQNQGIASIQYALHNTPPKPYTACFYGAGCLLRLQKALSPTRRQVSAGKPVSAQQLQPGDLVFFKASTKSSGKITHVGIVTEVSKDNARFIHASTSKGVIENDLLTGYWKPLLVKAVRVL